jgi:hypothetical protein
MASAAERRQQKAAKKKVMILIFMAVITAMTWGKTLFGKDDKPAAPTGPPPVAATPIPGAAGGAGPAPAGPRAGVVATATSSSISSYDQAVQRMTTWPSALKRRVHVGQIEEIVPFESEALDNTDLVEDPGPTAVATTVETAPAPLIEPDIRFEDLRLKLTTTAIFGKSRYARINGEKVIPGQKIEVQVGSETIRYEVSAINSREVEIRYSGETYLLRIAASSLLGGAQDGA